MDDSWSNSVAADTGVDATPAVDAPRLRIHGIHHVTMIVSDLERTTAFYRDLLGMTLLDAGVNADDPTARHFVFGNARGEAGSLLTFMEYPGMAAGEVGPGSTHHIGLRVGTREELEAWVAHLRGYHVQCTDPLERDGYASTYLRDPDGHIVELATDPAPAGGAANLPAG